MCHEMLAHWKMKNVWLDKSGTSYPVNEIWNGARFKELQWFWNPDSRWSLPHICKSCSAINSIEGVSINDPIDLVCPKCDFKERIIPNIVHGDPRNIALIGHWDGWQPGFGRGTSKGLSIHIYCFLICAILKFFIDNVKNNSSWSIFNVKYDFL